MSDDVRGTVDPATCGCCEGPSVVTPSPIDNRAGLAAIAARAGTYARFRESMHARLSAAGAEPGLAGLRTREPDDFSLALLDSWAMVADVLTFYQERIANESYLRTATEPRSLRELAAEIGYELGRGVAASTPLAFTVETVPGADDRTLIDAGTKVQSVPGPGELPQTFETSDRIEARPAWNAIRPRLTAPQTLHEDAVDAYLAGVWTDLRTGDGLLFVTATREARAGDGFFQFCRIVTATPDREAGHTLITWDQRLDADVAADAPSMYVLRQRASIFGYNAPDWRPLPDTTKANYRGIKDPADLVEDEKLAWPSFSIFSPEYPDQKLPPVIVNTPRAVALAATLATKKAVAEQQRLALEAAAHALELSLQNLKDIGTLLGHDTQDIWNEIVSIITNQVNALKTAISDAMGAIGKLGEIDTAIVVIKQKVEDVTGFIQKLQEKFAPDPPPPTPPPPPPTPLPLPPHP